jgi:hypothetical protein
MPSGAAMGFPSLFSPRGTTTETLSQVLTWGSLDDVETPGRRKAGDETGNDLTGVWTKSVRWIWSAWGVFAVLPRRESA